jgi:GT2 family glycosyltransferase
MPGEHVRPDFSVIVVSWNTRDFLHTCLQSILEDLQQASRAVTAEIIVVDNASTDGSAAMVQHSFPQARLIQNTGNAGFAAANNQATAEARGRIFFLLNPDAYLRPGALAGLARFMDQHPAAAVVGPQVRNPDGTWQAAAFRFPTLWDLFCEAVFLSVLWPHSPLFARKELGGFDRTYARPVDWVQGCALAVRREVWQAVGPFDEGYWMYVEELDWCRRARAMGYQAFFTPDAEVVHYGRRAVARARAAVLPLGFRSHFRYYRKFDGPATEAAVRLITILQMGLRAALSTAMVVLSRGTERARWRENLRAYTGVIREALRFKPGDSLPAGNRPA